MEEVKKWLNGLNLAVYYEGFIDNGYDDLDAIRLDPDWGRVINDNYLML